LTIWNGLSGVDTSLSVKQKIQYIVQPGGKLIGTIRVPGDKSISHRAIMLGAIADGVTEVTGFLEGEDALATLSAFRKMGVMIEGPKNGSITVHGVGMHGLSLPKDTLDLDDSLAKRPMGRVIDPLVEMGAIIGSDKGKVPLYVQGGKDLSAITYELPMASAQVKSCLLFAGMYAKGKTIIIEPAPTRDHSERMLTGMGYPIKVDGNKVTIEGGGKLTATEIDVPSDISSATFFIVGATIAKDSDITLKHVGINPTRIGVINILRQMGADITISNERKTGGEPVADIRVRYAVLKGIDVPVEQVPLAIDEFPAIFIAAACAEGVTVLTGAEELRVKESDRIKAMADGLKLLGIDASATHDGMIIYGGMIGSGEVDSLGDHRIAMSFAIAGLQAGGTIVIRNCTNVKTSFPNFVELAMDAGLAIEEHDE
jgi:3-phosphoshikimate 1-carboxyvinyltransferase